MPRVVLVDDEPPARRGLRRLLSRYDDITIVGEAGTVDEARAVIAATRPDAVFLDIELTSGKGFDIVSGLSPDISIIVVSAYDLYAIDAFDAAALDFLVKPVEPERLDTAIARLRKRHARSAARPEPKPMEAGAPRLLLKTVAASIMVATDAITHLVAEGDFTRVHLDTGQAHLVGGLLRKYEDQLASPPFHRLSRSLIVNLQHLRVIEWLGAGRGRIQLNGTGQAVDLGRSATKRLRDLLDHQATETA